MDAQKNILIVEDDPHLAEDIRIKVESLGYRVIDICAAGREAIATVHCKRPDLVLMDIVLPGDMDGIEAAERIRACTGIPVVFLTAYSNQQFLDRAKTTEPLAYLLKPYTARDLSAVLTIAFYRAEIQRQCRERAFLTATLVSLSEALIVWDLQGKVTLANDACVKLLRLEGDIVGQAVADVLELRDYGTGEPVTAGLLSVLEKEAILRDERDLLVMRGDGSACPVRVSGRRIRDEKDDTHGFLLLIRDNSESKRSEKALKESEERFQQLADHIDSAFCLVELAEGRIIYANKAFDSLCAESGGHEGEAERRIDDTFLACTGHDGDALMVAIRSGQPCEKSFLLTWRDGRLRWVHARCYPVTRPGTGDVYRVACVVDDITERRRLEEKLKQSAAVFDNTVEGILITDSDLKIIAVNKAFCDITGYTEADVIGRSPRLLKSGLHDDDFYRAMWRSLNETGHWQGEVWNRKKNGEIYPQWMTVSEIRGNNDHVVNYVSTGSDITSLKKTQEKLDYLAHHDHLTGFANRLLFNARLSHAIERARRDKGKVAVLLMDLDRFKEVNDSMGHATGDALLQLVARRLSQCVREEDTLARLGGDEFALVLEDCCDTFGVISVAEKVLSAFSLPFSLDNRELIVTVSIGVSIYPNDGSDVTTLVRHADMAMYRAKDQGRNRYRLYTEDMTADTFARLTLEAQMRQALTRREFELYFQPQLSLKSGKIIGAEALIRWHHPEMGLVPPGRFIPLAEETGLIEPLGEWVLMRACKLCKRWHEEGLPGLVIAVNLSPRQVVSGEIADTVKSVLKESGLEPNCLELEITETSLMQQAEDAKGTLESLKALGVKIAIDDFGTGYSSLSYLKRFPVDKLKIDHSFILDIPHDSQDIAISKAILALGRSLDLTVIAEGVETEAQKAFLLAETCDEMQGYLLSKPLPADEFFRLVKDHSGSIDNS